MNMSINDNAKKTNFFGAWQRVDTETSPHATKINL